MTKLILTLFIAAQAVCSAAGGFTFVAERVKKTAKPDAKSVVLEFPFENKTKRVLEISRYDSACSCLSTEVANGKMKYKPGEKGTVRITFELGSFSGMQVKTVALWTTDDPEEKPSSILTVELTIPKLFEVLPNKLFWQQGAAGTPQKLRLKVNHTEPIQILKYSSINSNFSCELKTIKPGWEYEMTVTPKGTATPSFGMIRILTNAKIKRFQRAQAFVYVQRKKPQPAKAKPAATVPSSN
ncbi:MAG: DUF1573 domain-containing protein [Akkermansiaceae bacterium]